MDIQEISVSADRQLTLLRMAARVDPHLRQAVEDVEQHIDQLAARIVELEAALESVAPYLAGWREVVCEIEDLGPPEHVAKATYAVVDQMDRAKAKLARKEATDAR